MIDHIRQNTNTIKTELEVTKNNLELVRKETKIRKERMNNAFRSVFGTIKSEISCIKTSARTEIDALQKLVRTNMESIKVKLNEATHK